MPCTFSVATLLLTFAAASPSPAEEPPWVIGIEELHRIDLLPAYRRSVKIGAVTSYDRTEGNDDGFSGKYSFVGKEEGGSLILADLKGPGCIYRIHTPTPTDEILAFYFDGETSPRLRLPYRELFKGGRPPFIRPLVDSGGGEIRGVHRGSQGPRARPCPALSGRVARGGEPIDLYSQDLAKKDPIPMGAISAKQGANHLMFKIVGKNDASKALGFDLIDIICHKAD